MVSGTVLRPRPGPAHVSYDDGDDVVCSMAWYTKIVLMIFPLHMALIFVDKSGGRVITARGEQAPATQRVQKKYKYMYYTYLNGKSRKTRKRTINARHNFKFFFCLLGTTDKDANTLYDEELYDGNARALDVSSSRTMAA